MGKTGLAFSMIPVLWLIKMQIPGLPSSAPNKQNLG
jgi:hypothetical protein